MLLSKRLESILELVPESATACDIGCDHAYVAIELAQRNIVKTIYALDVNEGPLAIAGKNVKASGLNRRIKCILSDGLTALEKDCECIIIAGMGGALIERILEDSRDKVLRAKTLVLSPHSQEEKVRKKIYDLGFYIEKEVFVLDDSKPYFIIRAKQGMANYSYSYEYSEYLISTGNKDYHSFLLKNILKIKILLPKLPKLRRAELETDLLEMEKICDEIKRNSK